MSMSVETALQWVDDLCSGEFVQVRKAFELEGRHCCLAVLDEQFDYDRDKTARLDEERTLEQAGLTHSEADRAALYFINLNDGEKASYEDIADVILSGDWPGAPKEWAA